jgi:hypothetical protein
MDAHELNEQERLALMGLLRLTISADVTLSQGESQQLKRIAADMGQDAFREGARYSQGQAANPVRCRTSIAGGRAFRGSISHLPLCPRRCQVRRADCGRARGIALGRRIVGTHSRSGVGRAQLTRFLLRRAQCTAAVRPLSAKRTHLSYREKDACVIMSICP